MKKFLPYLLLVTLLAGCVMPTSTERTEDHPAYALGL